MTEKCTSRNGLIISVNAAKATRTDVTILAEDSVLSTAALPDFRGVEETERRHELEEFHAFVENLSPEDFNVAPGEKDTE